MFSKKSFIKLFSVGMILFQCNTSVVVKKPELSNFLEIKEKNNGWDLLKNLEKNTPPAQANAISISSSKGIARAVDNSVAQVVNAVKSTQAAEANAKEGSIALAVSSGNTGLTTDAQAEDASNAIGVGVAATVGKATADAEQGSVAVAANQNQNCSDNKLLATNGSNAASVSSSVSGADAASIASQGSLADSKAIDTVKTESQVKAADNSVAAANTSNESLSTTNANAINSSQAKSLSESNSNAKTNLAAVEASKAAGNLDVKSGADSVANAVNGGNALSTSQGTTNGDNTGCAEKGSTVVLNNTSENQAKAVSNSEGTLAGAATLPRPAEQEETPVLQAGNGRTEENQDICANIIRKDEGGSLGGARNVECGTETLRGGRTEEGQDQAETQEEGDQEQVACATEDRSGTGLRQDRNQETEKKTARNQCELRAGSEREEAEYKCRRAPKRSNRLRSRREQRKLRRKELRQARRRCAEKEEDVCESSLNRPILTVEKTVPNVNLEACANDFIHDNANNIKQQSADNLAKVQNLLKKATC